MSSPTRNPSPGHNETVEDTFRYAAHRFNAAGMEFRPAKMSKLIRQAARTFDGGARAAVDAFLDREIDNKLEGHLWSGFELFVATGHADPTGALAAQHLDATNTAELIRSRRQAIVQVTS